METVEAGNILVFDSGIGGLTIAREIRAMAPMVKVNYAADTGFFPYGEKSDAALQDRLPRIAEALVEAARTDVFVIACNTASTLALDAVRAKLTIPVVGTVPAIKPAVAVSRSKTIGLLATPGTIRRDYTAQLVAKYAGDATIVMHGSLSLVHMAEAIAAGEPVALEAFREVVRPLFEADTQGHMDTIVLACTHFPLVRGELAASVPRPVHFIDSGEAIARQTLRVLPHKPTSLAPSGHVWLSGHTDPASRVIEVARRFGFDKVGRVML